MVDILKYVWQDMLGATKFVPYGILFGVPVAWMIVGLINAWQISKNGARTKLFPVMLFCFYIFIIGALTVFSRENGSRTGILDMKLFATWGINSRNNAYVIENILLFFPYGFLLCWVFGWRKKLLWRGVSIGFLSSLFIETIQLIFRRGYFQIDDIITNTLGAFFGSLLYFIIILKKTKRSDR